MLLQTRPKGLYAIAQTFLGRLDEAMRRWTATLAPVNGARVVTYHPAFSYFLTRFGLVQAGTIEDRPGIPPSSVHLTELIRRMNEERIKVVIVQPWVNRSLAGRVAQDAGAPVVTLTSVVGGVGGADTYIGAIDHNVKALAEGCGSARCRYGCGVDAFLGPRIPLVGCLTAAAGPIYPRRV